MSAAETTNCPFPVWRDFETTDPWYMHVEACAQSQDILTEGDTNYQWLRDHFLLFILTLNAILRVIPNTEK